MKRIQIKQHDITDCGAACLASIAAHYRMLMPVARIRQLASTDKKGTNVLGLIEAAKRLGFQAKGVKAGSASDPLESLSKIPLPTIAHVVVRGGLHHYVVLYKITTKHVVVMDPGDGRMHRKALDTFKAK